MSLFPYGSKGMAPRRKLPLPFRRTRSNSSTASQESEGSSVAPVGGGAAPPPPLGGAVPAAHHPPPPPGTKRRRTAVVVARHAERLDAALLREGRNWVAEQKQKEGEGEEDCRPWDPPLTPAGLAQSRALGRHLNAELRRRGLPPVSAAYSSPMMRCVQTAAAALGGAAEEEEGAEARRERVKMLRHGRHIYGWAGAAAGAGNARAAAGGDSGGTDGGAARRPKVRVEEGLMESLKEKWYQSWCLPGSDSTWGYEPTPVEKRDGKCGAEGKTLPTATSGENASDAIAQPPAGSQEEEKKDDDDDGTEDMKNDACAVDARDVHPFARNPIQSLLASPSEIARRLSQLDQSAPPHAPLSQFVDCDDHVRPLCPIGVPYRWGRFELSRHQTDRVAWLVHRVVSEVHPGETVLLVTHGGPMAHVYTRLTGGDWKAEHGVGRYSAFDLYEYVPGTGGPEADREAAAEAVAAGTAVIARAGAARYEALVVNSRDHLPERRVSPAAAPAAGGGDATGGKPPRAPVGEPLRGIQPLAAYKVRYY